MEAAEEEGREVWLWEEPMLEGVAPVLAVEEEEEDPPSGPPLDRGFGKKLQGAPRAP